MSCLYKVLKNAQVTYDKKTCYLGGEKLHEDRAVSHKVMDDFHMREKALEEMTQQAKEKIEQDEQNFLAKMRIETERIVENAKRECSAMAIEQAKAGFDVGIKIAEKRCEEIDKELNKLKAEITSGFDLQMSALKENVVDLALVLARKIINIELEKDDAAILSALNDVLIRFKDEKNLSIEISEELASKLDIEKLKPIYEINVNRELTNEEILLNSNYGTIDASIDAQFENLKKALLEECK